MSKETGNSPIPSEESPEPKSYAEWLARFYPTDAKEFVPADGEYLYFFTEYGEKDRIPPEQKAQEISALKHSIRKWEGLRPETLREYKVYYYSVLSCVRPNNISPEEFDSYFEPHLYIDATSCALCALKVGSCEDCSIAGYLASTKESKIPADELNCLKQFRKMVMDKDPEPMISLLNETLKWVEGLEIKND